MMDDLDFGLGARAPRFLLATLQIALAVFFAAMGFGILSATMTGPPAIAWLLRGFILLMFGGIAAGSLFAAFRTIRGDDAKSRRAPEAALAHCLVCGERSPADVVCPFCAEPPGDRRAALVVERKGYFGLAFAVALAGALLCLGLFILIGPFFDGERRVWALIAFSALGLLISALGVALLWGSLLALAAAIHGGARLSFRLGGPERTAWGSGAASWGQLVFLEGQARIVEPPVPQARSEGGYRVSPGDLAFAEMIATLDASGIVRLSDVTTYEWCLGDKPAPGASPALRSPDSLAFGRKAARSTQVVITHGGALHDDDPVHDDSPHDDPEALVSTQESHPETPTADATPLHSIVRHFFFPWFADAPQLDEARRRIDADPARRAQALAHTRALVDAGVRVSPELVDAVLCRLDKP